MHNGNGRAANSITDIVLIKKTKKVMRDVS